MFRKAFAAAALAVTAFTVPAQAEPLKELNFGIISTESTQNLKSIWTPFLDDMEKALGMKVNAFFAPDYAGVIEGMRFDKVDVAWYGNKSAMEAVDRAGGEIFAQTVDAEGNPGYWSLLVTHKDSPLNSLQDVLKCDGSLNLGYGDPNSTSGFLVPSYYVFAKNGVDPKDCFKTVRNANHETNLMAAANKQVDVATNNTENLRRMEIKAPEIASQIKVLWRSPLIPADPIVWRSNLDEADKAKIYKFFMSYGRMGTADEVARSTDILEALQWAPFNPSSDNQLVPIRQLALFKDRAKIATDEHMNAADKEKKLAEIDAKLADLNTAAAKLGM
ncbi:MAG: alkylphosphonate ABC transporter substrate-binding protein [Rhodospirillaceae bacterium BRH_c57]|nr:MAG: alkylphosphonate ABC transporter substrate-binding protein [Rhodospirillaceae bacterium BRH_c57]